MIPFDHLRDEALRECEEYYSVVICCNPEPYNSEGWSPTLCSSSFYELFYSGGEAPAVCAELIPVALHCAIAVGEQSCAELQHYFEGLDSGVTKSSVGAPTDPTMPCYEEVVAIWDAGCEPFLI